jgi:SNF2 family DNA or RNA helicase
MINPDFVFDFVRSKIDQVLFDELTEVTVNEYFQAKEVQQEYIQDLGFSNVAERLLYDMLELCVFFDQADIDYSTAEQLAKILSIDHELRTYCQHHVLSDGLWGKLKYDIQIHTKRELIADALELSK